MKHLLDAAEGYHCDIHKRIKRNGLRSLFAFLAFALVVALRLVVEVFMGIDLTPWLPLFAVEIVAIIALWHYSHKEERARGEHEGVMHLLSAAATEKLVELVEKVFGGELGNVEIEIEEDGIAVTVKEEKKDVPVRSEDKETPVPVRRTRKQAKGKSE